jgi:Domain of unknown function (DUF4397)
MHTRRLILFMAVAATILAACDGAPAAGTAPPAPTAPTAGAVPMAVIASTAPTAANAPTAGIVSTVPNDAMQARLRMSNCIMGGRSVDVVINGAVAVNGGRPQANLRALFSSGYLYLTPGTYSIAVVPIGKGLAQVILGPRHVPLAAGHRYTIVVLRQVGEPYYTPLMIDETAAYLAVGATPASDADITVNNIKRAQGIGFFEGGIVRDKDVPYGGYKAAIWPVGNFKDFAITSRGGSQVANILPCFFLV